MDGLNLYFIAFAWQDYAISRDWHAAAGYIFAKDAVLVEDLLTKKGTVLYGSRWRTL